jgi:hypothetical protein
MVPTYDPGRLGLVEREVEFGAAAGNGKILGIDRSNAEHIPCTQRRRLVRLIGGDLQR